METFANSQPNKTKEKYLQGILKYLKGFMSITAFGRNQSTFLAASIIWVRKDETMFPLKDNFIDSSDYKNGKAISFPHLCFANGP